MIKEKPCLCYSTKVVEYYPNVCIIDDCVEMNWVSAVIVVPILVVVVVVIVVVKVVVAVVVPAI